LGLAFISGAVLPARFIAAPAAEPSPGEFSFGGIILPSQRRKAGTFTAIDVAAGAQRWQNHTSVPLVGGALVTSGGLVFYGEGARTEGAFIALDAETGGELFRFPTTGGVNAAPMTFVAQGKQLITIAAGGNVLSLSSLDNLLITFELP
jgi:glucose dehydrogenase